MTPTRAQRLAAFEALKKVVEGFVAGLIGEWSEFGFSDDELHQLSDAEIEAALAVEENK
jgi:hypothetical protein